MIVDLIVYFVMFVFFTTYIALLIIYIAKKKHDDIQRYARDTIVWD